MTLASFIDHIPWSFGLVLGWQQTIVVMGEIGAEGWVAIPRVVEHLQGGRPGVILRCDREDMATGRAA